MDTLTPQQLEALIQANTTGPFAGKITPEYLVADQSWRLIRVVIALAILEVLFVGLFFISRIRIGTANGLDTYLIVPAFLITGSHLILCWIFVKDGHLGKHVVTLTPATQVIFLKLELALAMLNGPAITLPKLAILCLYLRVFTTKPYKYSAYAIISVLIVTYIIYFGVSMGMCVPFNYQWNKTIPGHCLDQFKIYIWIGLPSIFTDLAIIILPLPLIWRLQTSTNQKVGLTLTFLTGSVGIFTAIIRFAVFLKLRNPGIDLTWTGIDVVLWTVIEPSVYLIAACLPSLRPLFNPFFKEFDFRKMRAQFAARGSPPKSPPSETIGDIHLSGVTVAVGDSNMKGTRSPRSPGPRSGFRRLNEPSWPGSSFYEGNKNTGLATCYRERDSEDSGRGSNSQTELQGDSQYSYGIVVQKAFTISTEPVRT